jgi:hypothetical protein
MSESTKKCWPRSSYIAINILLIPTISDEFGRIILETRRTISWKRTQFSIKNIEKLEYLKSWRRNNISNE